MTTVIWGEDRISCPCGEVFSSGFVRNPTIRPGYRYHLKSIHPCPSCQAKEYLVPKNGGPMVNVNSPGGKL